MGERFQDCMVGRTMYVIPFSMGHVDSPISKTGIEVTDSPYVATSMRVMTRMGDVAVNKLGENGIFTKCLHSVGVPLTDKNPEDAKLTWPENHLRRQIAHFPEDNEIQSYGSGYGGNALLGKKCMALRLGSYNARNDEETWLAEHMLIMSVTNPEGVSKTFCAAFPSACGKTNLAMLEPPEEYVKEGWKVRCIGDDISWMKVNKKDGNIYAMNPENGFFGVAPGTNYQSNKNCMKTLEKDVIFTNVAVDEDGNPWWKEKAKRYPDVLTSWKNEKWIRKDWLALGKLKKGKELMKDNTPDHGNARFCAPVKNCPVRHENWSGDHKVDAFLFGGRRESGIPLVFQSRDWEHGVFTGATMLTYQSVKASDSRGQRHDPFAMRPFVGYNMGHYFRHWLDFRRKVPGTQPKIFHVNWFRQGKDGEFLWDGFSENMRVVEWIFNQCDKDNASDGNINSSLGFLPNPNDIRLDGYGDLSEAEIEEFRKTTLTDLLSVEEDVVKEDVQKHLNFFSKFTEGSIPVAIWDQLVKKVMFLDDQELLQKVKAAKKVHFGLE